MPASPAFLKNKSGEKRGKCNRRFIFHALFTENFVNGRMEVSMGKTVEKVFISEADQYLFAQGTHYDIYKKLGAHLSVENGEKGMMFAVWAPHAAQVM